MFEKGLRILWTGHGSPYLPSLPLHNHRIQRCLVLSITHCIIYITVGNVLDFLALWSMPFSLGQTQSHLYLVVWKLSHLWRHLQSIRINHAEDSASWCMMAYWYQRRVILSYCNRCWSKCILYLLITSLLSNFLWNVFETLCPLPCTRKPNTL